jgi:hypothetical protein
MRAVDIGIVIGILVGLFVIWVGIKVYPDARRYARIKRM